MQRKLIMQSALRIVMVTALAVLLISCGPGSGPPDEPSPAGPPGQPSPPVSVTGTWSGTGLDSNSNPDIGQGTTIVTWTLAQTDASVSGTVTTKSTDLPNTTCNSCHRTKTGTLSGTIAGTTLTWTMSFPGAAGDPCPTCTAVLTGTVSLSGITEGSLRGLYTGNDSCEGQFLGGTLTLARQP